jgi:uncharacterized protein YjcR
MQHEWEKIKSDYVTGRMTMRELAEKYGVSLSTLGKRASREGWAQRREHHNNKVAAKVEEKRAGRKAEKILRLQEAADRMQQHIDKVLADEEQFHRYLVSFGTKEVIHKKADTKAIKDMTSALKDLTDIIRDVYGMPAADLKHRMKMDKEKLKLEKEKAAMGFVSTEETGVVFLSPVMEADKPPEIEGATSDA